MSATTLVGNNSFLIEQILNDRIDKFKAKNGNLGVEYIDVQEIDVQEMLSQIISVSLFSTTKLVLLKNVSQNNGFLDCLEELVAQLGSIELIIVDPQLDGRSKLYKKLRTLTDFQLVNQLSPLSLIDWAIEYVKSKNGIINRASAGYLIDKIGPNQLVCYQELNKLMLYNKKINQESIDLLVETNPRSTIFDLVKVAFKHNHRSVMELYQQLRISGEDTSKMIGLLAWQLHLLAVVKTANNRSNIEIANDLGANPKTISETKNIARDISLDSLRQIINRLLEIDSKSKQQTLNIDDALLYFLLSF